MLSWLYIVSQGRVCMFPIKSTGRKLESKNQMQRRRVKAYLRWASSICCFFSLRFLSLFSFSAGKSSVKVKLDRLIVGERE